MRDIKGFEGRYAITSCGRVWSYKSEKWLKPKVDKDGYYVVGLHKEGKVKFFLVHRLVALAYIPNTEGLPEVNHKDEVKSHNWVGNLEFCDHDYNTKYGTAIERAKATRAETWKNKKKGKATLRCIELDETFCSQAEASKKYNIDQGDISRCIHGKRNFAGRHPITGEDLHWEMVA